MQTEYLDEHKNEFVITKKDNYRTWNNYLGNTEFGLVINDKGLGYNNLKYYSDKQFTSLRQNIVPEIQPRAILIKDNSTMKIWSTVSSDQDAIDNYFECRHGSDYTVIKSESYNVFSETTYFVPQGEMFEIWFLKLSNQSSNDLNITLSTLNDFQLYQSGEFTDNLDHLNNNAESNIISPIYFFSNNDVGVNSSLSGFWENKTRKQTVSHKINNGSLAMQIDTELKSGGNMNFVVFAGPENEKTRIVEKYGNLKLVENELNKILNNKTCVTNAIRIF